jgi:hypothetical protein
MKTPVDFHKAEVTLIFLLFIRFYILGEMLTNNETYVDPHKIEVNYLITPLSVYSF